jgi:hypothetical protein
MKQLRTLYDFMPGENIEIDTTKLKLPKTWWAKLLKADFDRKHNLISLNIELDPMRTIPDIIYIDHERLRRIEELERKREETRSSSGYEYEGYRYSNPWGRGGSRSNRRTKRRTNRKK